MTGVAHKSVTIVLSRELTYRKVEEFQGQGNEREDKITLFKSLRLRLSGGEDALVIS